MDFTDTIHAHGARINELKTHAVTEEATKTSLILPFLQTLGYNPFDPRVVIPEFTADVGTKKGEKVDYAIQRNGEVIILIETKCAGDSLDSSKASQLHRYFHNILSAKIAILTDGVVYKFFTDLEKQNIMDEKPFMIFDFAAIDVPLIAELKKLCNDCFDAEVALCAAQDLKYLRQIKHIIASEMDNPSEELIKHFAHQVFSGYLRNTVIDEFRPRIQLAFTHHINDVINARLQGAMLPNAYPDRDDAPEVPASVVVDEEKRKPTTTQEEIEGYLTVKAILREILSPDRVIMHDKLSYCGILLDGNNRKPICHLYFNSAAVKYIKLFDADKKAQKHKIESLNDIYKYADVIKATAQRYDNGEEDNN
ncbi:MAG: restriction endonuclease [Candidatus Desulfovibrio kirbyi]|jgi:hypothetical protein|uniref:Restriction endonuclease n=1 Tax=Candidatus Desulfovibrio kirbyi TaxID=2696086 RepID=A0A6L2R7J1_9BACT|nr:MAG: restriction endonuclease [Candidatus Desulfovibrio kirbyi]